MVTRADVITRLAQLGYTALGTDTSAIDFELEKMTNYTLNYCNISEIPEIIYERLTDRVCSEFLLNKKDSGTMEGFDYDRAIKQIKEGDTTLSYASGDEGSTPESRFDAMVKHLERGYDKWITPFRRVRW